jgi:uncharacterized BrkB/YihY/UPF0761 family membrane protein
VLAVTRDREITFLAAAIAYYAFVSLLPALLLAVAVASTLGGETLAEEVLGASDEFLTPAGRESLESALTGARGRAGATVVGVALLLWSTLRVIRGLDVAFSRVYGRPPAVSMLDPLRRAVVVLLSVGVALGVMVGVGGALTALIPPDWDPLGLLLLLAGLTAVFLPLLLPPRRGGERPRGAPRHRPRGRPPAGGRGSEPRPGGNRQCKVPGA